MSSCVGLGVLDDHVEVAIFIEDAGVQQLVFQVLPAPLPVRCHQVVVGERSLRILVLTLQVGVGRGAVEVEPVLLHVLAVVSLAVVQAEHPLLQDRVLAVPQRQRETHSLALVADPCDAVLTPAIRARPRLLMGEVVPRIAVLAVVLAHRPPLPLREVGTPRLPGDTAGPRFLEPLVLFGLAGHRHCLQVIRRCGLHIVARHDADCDRDNTLVTGGGHHKPVGGRHVATPPGSAQTPMVSQINGVRRTPGQSGYSSLRQARGSLGWGMGVRSSRKLK